MVRLFIRLPATALVLTAVMVSFTSVCSAGETAEQLSSVLNSENADNGFSQSPAPLTDDHAFLRRVYVDLIGRIPTLDEIVAFEKLGAPTRRAEIVEKLMESERFADTWTVFYADMLRLRSNADGGSAAIAWVHKAVRENTPYDKLAYRFISANGKAGATPEVGFVLGDNADPMALAGATAQVFMGIRVACAQCHDHPFDKWTQKDFYSLAAYFGKTRRMETRFTNTVYTTEANQSSVLWPPEGMSDESDRKPLKPQFLFTLVKASDADYIQRLDRLRNSLVSKTAGKSKGPSVDDILSALDDKVDKAARGGPENSFDVASEAKRDARRLKINSGMASESELRSELADLVTDPRNTYFSRAFVNRVWGHLIGRGIVEPVDDFSDSNPPTHPRTLNFLAEEFVASGYDLKALIRTIIASEPYQRSHARGVDEATQAELEEAFAATAARRMPSEVIYDSIVTAGHLFEVKHAAGQNLRVMWQQSRVAKEMEEAVAVVEDRSLAASNSEPKMEMKAKTPDGRPSYNLESAIELDFDSVLKKSQSAGQESVSIEKMQVMSREELEAMRMQQEDQERRNVEFIDRFVKTTVDDNPKFSSSFRMASPAAPEHFLRVFGQTDRTQLGEHRDNSPSMRQALMMLNGRLTHEASRVGSLEPVHQLLIGENADPQAAVQLAYQEILTRLPTAEEQAEALTIVNEGNSQLEGMADLRWLLLNCDEFRFLP